MRIPEGFGRLVPLLFAALLLYVSGGAVMYTKGWYAALERCDRERAGLEPSALPLTTIAPTVRLEMEEGPTKDGPWVTARLEDQKAQHVTRMGEDVFGVLAEVNDAISVKLGKDPSVDFSFQKSDLVGEVVAEAKGPTGGWTKVTVVVLGTMVPEEQGMRYGSVVNPASADGGRAWMYAASLFTGATEFRLRCLTHTRGAAWAAVNMGAIWEPVFAKREPDIQSPEQHQEWHAKHGPPSLDEQADELAAWVAEMERRKAKKSQQGRSIPIGVGPLVPCTVSNGCIRNDPAQPSITGAQLPLRCRPVPDCSLPPCAPDGTTDCNGQPCMRICPKDPE